ncbi:MAG TPA: VWA domain-containing protein, partial [Thermomicrobiales bacterium]|nr:VWA domain-containing protein [Thermomicrobiales bacterium]
MTILAPLAALFALSLPAIIVLHLRRSRPRPLPVTTLRFWEEAQRWQRQRVSLRRPPRALLLALQLVAAALLTLALVRPALPLPWLPGNAAPGQLLLVLDRSAAMRATDVAPTRFDAARARALAAGAPAEQAVTVLTLGAAPQTLRSRNGADRAALLDALDRLAPGGGRADLNGALPLLRASLAPGQPNRIVVLSDGVFAAPPDRAALAALPAALTWERIGGPADNVAITTFTARRAPQAPDRLELFARVGNFSAAPVTAQARLEADGATLDERRLALPRGGAVDLVWQVPAATRGAWLHVAAPDALPADNDAQVVLRDVAQVNVLLVAAQPGDLGRALAAQPGVALKTVTPADYAAAPLTSPADLTVFDGVVPATLPDGGVLLVAPPADNPLLPATERQETPRVARVDTASPLLAGVDLGGVTFAAQRDYQLPAWATEVAGADDGPLIVRGQYRGHDVVAFTFDLAHSDLPKKLAFPLLIGNVVGQLQTHDVPMTADLGAGVSLRPVAGTARAQLRGPDGAVRDLALADTPAGVPAAYVTPDHPGLYALIERDASGTVLLQESFAVNAGDQVASNLRDVAADLPPGRGGAAPGLPETAGASVPRRLGELWPALLALALVILAIEWAIGLLGPASPRREAARVARRQ